MNRKITALLLSLIMIICQCTVLNIGVMAANAGYLAMSANGDLPSPFVKGGNETGYTVSLTNGNPGTMGKASYDFVANFQKGKGDARIYAGSLPSSLLPTTESDNYKYLVIKFNLLPNGYAPYIYFHIDSSNTVAVSNINGASSGLKADKWNSIMYYIDYSCIKESDYRDLVDKLKGTVAVDGDDPLKSDIEAYISSGVLSTALMDKVSPKGYTYLNGAQVGSVVQANKLGKRYGIDTSDTRIRFLGGSLDANNSQNFNVDDFEVYLTDTQPDGVASTQRPDIADTSLFTVSGNNISFNFKASAYSMKQVLGDGYNVAVYNSTTPRGNGEEIAAGDTVAIEKTVGNNKTYNYYTVESVGSETSGNPLYPSRIIWGYDGGVLKQDIEFVKSEAMTIDLNAVDSDKENKKVISFNKTGTSWAHAYIDFEKFPGSAYNKLKLVARVKDLDNTGGSLGDKFNFYYTADASASSITWKTKSFSIEDLTDLNTDKLHNENYKTYEIDLADWDGWSTNKIDRIRFTPAPQRAGNIYIEKIEFYYEEPSSGGDGDGSGGDGDGGGSTPPPTPPTPPTTPTGTDPAYCGGYIEYRFDDGIATSVNGKSGHSISMHRDGESNVLKVDSVKTSSNASGNVEFTVNADASKYYKMEMKVKLAGVDPTFNGTNEGKPKYALYFKNDTLGYSGTSQISGNYTATLNDADGKYYSDWQTIVFDLGTFPGWSTNDVTALRFDAIKDAEGTLYLDDIRLYSTPVITDVKFNGTAATEVPVTTSTVTLQLSQPVVKLNTADVLIEDEYGIKVSTNVTTNSSNNTNVDTITVNVADLKTARNYTFKINNSNTYVSDTLKLFGTVTETFTTEKSELEYEIASGSINADKATLTFDKKDSTPIDVIMIATIWNGNTYVEKTVTPYTVSSNGSVDIDYTDLTAGQRVEITVWKYTNGTVERVYGNQVYTFSQPSA